ncbi:hypothetical protein L596_023218 [Steinernema carpocapsae]|uniref:SXP/RAL-2 family protein Ani s 5-like cation-binding domain-containing protein n=1 Tax=Steinernema carpocapsae TaxID=34508 RepID=A0A4U5MD12_STECR|nr:hypothetical protein L596_023218 [Steinernema carpocapsae]
MRSLSVVLVALAALSVANAGVVRSSDTARSMKRIAESTGAPAHLKVHGDLKELNAAVEIATKMFGDGAKTNTDLKDVFDKLLTATVKETEESNFISRAFFGYINLYKDYAIQPVINFFAGLYEKIAPPARSLPRWCPSRPSTM